MDNDVKTNEVENNQDDKYFYIKLLVMILILVIGFLILALPSYYIPNTVPWT